MPMIGSFLAVCGTVGDARAMAGVSRALAIAVGATALGCAAGAPSPGLGLGTVGAETGGDDDDDDDGIATIDPVTGVPTGNDDDDATSASETGAPTGDDSGAMDTTGGGASCGDGTIDGDDKCDGSDLGKETCLTQGFDEGELGCSADCELDTSACVAHECGNDLLEGDEVCDGDDLAGEDCASQGFDAGTLACGSDCTLFDTSGCVLFSCGNGTIEGNETCDGADLGGETCSSQGLEGGTLACAADCANFNLAACTCIEQSVGGATGTPVASGSTAAEDDSLPTSCGGGGGNDRVIGFTAPSAGDYTIDTIGSSYDTVMSIFSSCDTGSEIVCDDDGGSGLTSAATVTLGAGESIVILVDGYMGDTGSWELNISSGGGSCGEIDIMSMLGSPVTSGSTAAEDSHFTQSCGGGDAVESVVVFVAPANGSYTFDTVGSDYDTVLAAYDDCTDASELACNDDTTGLQSEVTVNLSAGQEIFIAVSGYSGNTGNWVLNAVQN